MKERSERKRLCARCARGGKVASFETTLRAKDGSLIPVLISASMLFDEEGQEAGVVGFNKDLRERKEAEEAIRQAEEKYRNIFEHAIEGIFQTTPDGKYISANPSLARIYGYNSPEALILGLTDVSRSSTLTLGVARNSRVSSRTTTPSRDLSLKSIGMTAK